MPNDARQTPISTPTAILIGSVIVAAAIIFSNLYRAAVARQEVQGPGLSPIDEKSIVMMPVTESDHVYGNARAKVLMVEYADTQCPFCRRVHPVMRKIVDESNGEVAWVYRHFPLDDLHPTARHEAEAAECAAELGGSAKFWEYLHALFDAPTAGSSTPPSGSPPAARMDTADAAATLRVAAGVGIDRARFAACLSSGRHKSRVESHYRDGVKIGITGTPTTVLVNARGKKKVILGAHPEHVIEAAVNKLK